MPCQIKRQIPDRIGDKGTRQIIRPVTTGLLIACLIKICKVLIHQERSVSCQFHIRMYTGKKQYRQDQDGNNPVHPAQFICIPEFHFLPFRFFAIQEALFFYCFFFHTFFCSSDSSSSKFRRSSSTTRGRSRTLLLILSTYSPRKPIKNSCSAPRKNMPMTIGATPAEKRSQYISFSTR